MRYELDQFDMMLGADPELFFKKGRNTVESSNVLGKCGVSVIESNDICMDGVQVEIHPRPSHCRAIVAGNIKVLIRELKKKMDEQGVKADFSGVINIPKVKLDAMTDDAKKFGCKPSYNAYTGKESEITVNPAVYTYRSAGGHIHIDGNFKGNEGMDLLHNHTQLVVRCLDLCVGLVFVMIDTDKMQAERRKVYGRAGEYRLPKYGLEYRTLSNCWLRSYQLMSLAFGLVRLAVLIAYNIYKDEKNYQKSPYRTLFELAPEDKVARAINTNNYVLARRLWNKYKGTLMDIIGNDCIIDTAGYSPSPIGKSNIKEFEYFLKMIKEHGIEYWFPNDPITHWINCPEGHGTGFESWTRYHVKEIMEGRKGRDETSDD